MPLRLRVTGRGLRITSTADKAAPIAPSPPPPMRLATDKGDLLATEAGEHLSMESSHG